ncbi:MAG: hypothetical protein VKK42_25990 [Lyngbya sp.]|nr:hypothetical protein [Lyngbya sp.]
MFRNHRQQCWWFLNVNINSLPFKSGDWVKVVKKPKNAIAIRKGDVIQVEQVSPSKQMIRIYDCDAGWDYLSWDEIELTSPPTDLSVRDDSEVSVRDDKQADICDHQGIVEEIKRLFESVPVSLRDDILEELMSLRDDSIDGSSLSFRDDKPRIVWRSPAKREDKYPWFEWRGERAYIGGGSQDAKFSNGRIAKVLEWMAEKIPPGEIIRRIRAKEFNA